MTLATEIATDPIGIGYSGMTDAEVLASLTTATRPGRVPKWAVRNYLAGEGRYSKLVLAGRATVSPSETAINTLVILDSADPPDIDLMDPRIAGTDAVLDQLVSEGLITATHRAVILSMPTMSPWATTRSAELGLRGLAEAHITEARG